MCLIEKFVKRINYRTPLPSWLRILLTNKQTRRQSHRQALRHATADIRLLCDNLDLSRSRDFIFYTVWRTYVKGS